jgi:hypothetical protein
MLQEKKKEFPEKKRGGEKKPILFPDPSRPTFLQAQQPPDAPWFLFDIFYNQALRRVHGTFLRRASTAS